MQDGSIAATSYCGNSVLAMDPASKWRRSFTDALGRLTEVDEPNSPTASVTACPQTGDAIAATSYAYDMLGNLSTVTQSGSRQRTFTHDSLSRLVSGTNPETGAVSYTYDSSGNMLTKVDARSITTTYSYDVLNRLTSKTYSNGDPSVTYFYDQTTFNGLTIANGIGRRTGMTDAAGSEAWTYDSMGRETVDRRTTNGITKSTSYAYNLAGSLTSLAYPSGRSVTYSYDAAGRSLSAVDQTNSVNYVLSASYSAPGGLAGLTLGQTATFTGISLTMGYSPRLQPSSIVATSSGGAALNDSYNFVDANGHNNGTIASITNNLNSVRSQSFTYDEINRVKTAKTTGTTGSTCWGQSFNYDIWANLLSATATQCSAPAPSFTINANNQITNAGFSYDPVGNVLTDGSFTYTWNAESQMKTVAGVTYTYDGDGRRVQKSNSKLYWYGIGLEVLDESDAAGNITDEYAFFGGKRIARRTATGAIFYFIEDHLGTSRVVTQANGVVCYDADFLPFGAEQTVTNTCPQNYKFTGKERDA